MKCKEIKDIMMNGLLRQNAVLKLILGTCSVLALSVKAMNGLGMGIAVTFVLVCSNVMISALRNIIPDKVRIPAFIMVIATFVTIFKMLLTYLASMNPVAMQINKDMGVFLPLIVVNCIILARAESFASQNTVGLSALDGLFQGLGYLIVLTLMGAFREILGSGTIFGVVLWNFKIGFFTSAAGAFLTYGLFIAWFSMLIDKINKIEKAKKAKLKAQSKVNAEEVVA